MTYQEKIKYLWEQGEFIKCYEQTKDSKIKDLIELINKSGGIDFLPLGVVYSIIVSNSYLYNLLLELEKGNMVILKKSKKNKGEERK